VILLEREERPRMGGGLGEDGKNAKGQVTSKNQWGEV